MKEDIVINPYVFEGFGKCHSECKVTIKDLALYPVIIFTNTGVGTSVTNFAEGLITKIYNELLKDKYEKHRCRFYETYDDIEHDQVIPVWDGDEVTSVTWKPAIKFYPQDS